VTFEDFRRSALDSYRRGALTWETTKDAEASILFAADDFGAFHIFPVPPFFLRHERGRIDWLTSALPNIADNRSLLRVAFPACAWASRNPNYDDRSRDNPKGEDLLMVHIAEKGRYEVWQAEFRRSRSRLAGIGDWQLSRPDDRALGREVPGRIAVALGNRSGKKGPTIPAADMVLHAWDVPSDYIPLSNYCGPVAAKKNITSSYASVFRSETASDLIVSQAFVFTDGDHRRSYIDESVQAIHDQGLKEFGGPTLGEWTQYVEGSSDGDRLYKYAALWRRANAFLEVMVAGPRGRFTKAHLFRYTTIQDGRARSILERYSSIAS
jgi:hypothetical protein